MTDTFTASNDVQVWIDHLGSVRTESPNPISAFTSHTQALREFFQHERDEELGRWRWPDNPQYVVYPRGDSGVRVLDEGSGIGSARLIHRNGDPDNPTAEYQAAYAYFGAHPERKPWHSAKPGEIWVLTIDDSEQVVSAVQQYEKDFNPISHPIYATFANGSERITAGRRIWPEDAS